MFDPLSILSHLGVFAAAAYGELPYGKIQMQKGKDSVRGLYTPGNNPIGLLNKKLDKVYIDKGAEVLSHPITKTMAFHSVPYIAGKRTAETIDKLKGIVPDEVAEALEKSVSLDAKEAMQGKEILDSFVKKIKAIKTAGKWAGIGALGGLGALAGYGIINKLNKTNSDPLQEGFHDEIRGEMEKKALTRPAIEFFGDSPTSASPFLHESAESSLYKEKKYIPNKNVCNGKRYGKGEVEEYDHASGEPLDYQTARTMRYDIPEIKPK